MQTAKRCIADLIRLSEKGRGKITSQAIGDYFAEWRAIENNLLYKCQSKLTDDEHERRAQAYHLGGSDVDMAARLGISAEAFGWWRRRNGLPPKGISGKRLGRAIGTDYGGGMA